jgi:hypothetical protein
MRNAKFGQEVNIGMDYREIEWGVGSCGLDSSGSR